MGHIHELYDFTTSAFIINDGRVLLQHHKKIKMWLQPGGHVELEEDPIEALYRELEEETGLLPENLQIIELVKDKRIESSGSKLLPIPFDFNVHSFNNNHKHIDLCYLMISNTNDVTLEVDKAHDIQWFTVDQMRALLDDNLIYQETIDLAEIALRHAA